MIPFVDLKAQYLSIKEEIDNAIKESLLNTTFIGGENVVNFENDFSKFINVKNVISCANGTDSIEILLKAHGIGKGDEVIVPALSWISTSEAVSSVGAVPIFVDIEEDYYTINPSLIESKISKKTKAIIPVHIYGQVCEMDKILEIALEYNLIVIEDVAQAHNAYYKNKITGSIGDSASFSFYPGKNLGAYGDAGAIVTKINEIATRARMIANHGQIKKHTHIIEGRNSRLDAIQAKILSVKLLYLEKWTNSRIENALEYKKNLENLTHIKLPLVRKNTRHVFHLFVIRSKKRDDLQKYLEAKGIQTAIHYPEALPYLECYKSFGYVDNDFPIAKKITSEILSLPMYAELTDNEIKYISDCIKIFLLNEKD